jgi:4-hydroxy 2-oxovalerate aldolase
MTLCGGKMQKLLDCTLRDGGYVNDWNFGKDSIHSIKENLEKSGVEMIEMGFLKNVTYDPDKTLFPGVEWAEDVIYPKKKDVTYCLMVDAPTPFPIEKISNRVENGIDAIRIIMWKELVNECIDYSRKLIEKGYQVFIQPVRVNQYTPLEFAKLVNSFRNIGITAFYIVDSWGTQDSSDILSYMRQAGCYFDSRVSLGYHGHNNGQQTISCAEKLLQFEFRNDIILDCSIFGMGRNAGNLNTELIMAHLNQKHYKKYNIKPILNSYSNSIKGYYDKFGWGYSMEHFITSIFNCNTKYIEYIVGNSTLSMDKIYELFGKMTEKQRIDYSETLIKELINGARA